MRIDQSSSRKCSVPRSGGLSGQIEAVERLTARVLGSALAKSFLYEDLPGAASADAFVLDQKDGRILVRGNSGSALTSGLNWYLTKIAGASVSWKGLPEGQLTKLPRLAGTVQQESWARWRYFLNYCCFSYSLAFWSWEEWEPFIDGMALRGVNLPLAMTGQEAVWMRVGRRLGLSDDAMKTFLPGAAFLPFGWMGCLDGWTGPLSDEWIAGHADLGSRILKRQRELGMTPVLQGFTGHVPAALKPLFPEAKFQSVRWLEWETILLDPTDPIFAQVAEIYLEEQTALFGTDHYYAADTFIEMVPPSGDPEYLAELGRAVYQGMARSDPQAVWVLQGWPFHYKKEFWTQPRLRALLDAVPDERMLLLDLYCESNPMWDKTEAFCGKPWLWCNVQSFGANVVLTGALEASNTGLMQVRQSPLSGRLSGMGMVNEGLCPNPAVYDFFFERAWHRAEADLAGWGRAYAAARYGRDLPEAAEAWEILCVELYGKFRAEESGLVKCPTFAVQEQTSEETAALRRVWTLLLAGEADLGGVEAWQFDLIHVGRQVLSNLGNSLKADLHEAITSRDAERFEWAAARLRNLISDLARLLSAHEEFRLETWLGAAERWAASEEERTVLRRSALRQITLWGDGDETLRDYARKEWSGLLLAFYLPRWEAWFAFAGEALRRGEAPDEEVFRKKRIVWERQWIQTARPVDPPREQAAAMARQLHRQYVVEEDQSRSCGPRSV